jgi:hypothetical protein
LEIKVTKKRKIEKKINEPNFGCLKDPYDGCSDAYL